MNTVTVTKEEGWIAVDLDGTLAHYEGWNGPHNIGNPLPLMLTRVSRWLSEGRDVRIFTARVSGDSKAAALALPPIEAWCQKHLGQVLPVTCKKDYGMIELWDDRCVQIITNVGRTLSDELRIEISRAVAAERERCVEIAMKWKSPLNPDPKLGALDAERRARGRLRHNEAAWYVAQAIRASGREE